MYSSSNIGTPHAIFMSNHNPRFFALFGMLVVVYWLNLTSEKVVPVSVTVKTPLSDNNKYITILMRS